MTTAPDPSLAGSTSSAPVTPHHRAGRGHFVLGIVIGAAVSVAILLPAALNALTSSAILNPVAESGFVVVLVLIAIVVAIWAVLDGVPAWRERRKHAMTETAR